MCSRRCRSGASAAAKVSLACQKDARPCLIQLWHRRTEAWRPCQHGPKPVLALSGHCWMTTWGHRCSKCKLRTSGFDERLLSRSCSTCSQLCCTRRWRSTSLCGGFPATRGLRSGGLQECEQQVMELAARRQAREDLQLPCVRACVPQAALDPDRWLFPTNPASDCASGGPVCAAQPTSSDAAAEARVQTTNPLPT